MVTSSKITRNSRASPHPCAGGQGVAGLLTLRVVENVCQDTHLSSSAPYCLMAMVLWSRILWIYRDCLFVNSLFINICYPYYTRTLLALLIPRHRFLLQGVCGCDRFSSGSIRDVLKTIVKKDGYRGLMRGWAPRMMFHAPAAAICWSTYEAAKTFFQELNDQKNSSSLT